MRELLLVNDSRLEARILTDMLQSLGYTVHVSEETRALDDMRALAPDVVVVNYIMRTMRGDALIGMLKLIKPDALAILTSSSLPQLDVVHHRRVDALLRTPASREDLQRVLSEARQHLRQVSMEAGA